MGKMATDKTTTPPILDSITASGAKELQGVLGGGLRAQTRFKNLTASLKTHRGIWPKSSVEAQEKEIENFRKRIEKDGGSYKEVLTELANSQRLLARKGRQLYTQSYNL